MKRFSGSHSIASLLIYPSSFTRLPLPRYFTETKMTDKSIWDKEIPVPERLIQYIDPGVLKCTFLSLHA